MDKIIQRENVYLSITLFALLAAAAALRFWQLGVHGLWTDELYHALAAKSLLTEGRPYIPIMGEYTRALPYTWLVAISFKLFGVSEFAARLPSVLFGLSFIIILFMLVRKLFNTPIALLSAVMVTFSPLFIELSRESRMYPLFQLLFFVAVYFFFTGLEPQNSDGRFRSGVHVGRLALAAIFFYFSWSIHLLTLNFGMVVLGYLLMMWAYTFWQPNKDQGAFYKYAIPLVGAGAIGLLVFVFAGDRLADLWEAARHIPAFSSRKLTDYGFYRYYLSNNYPALFFLYPLSALLMVRAYGRKGLFFALLFIILIIAHTFLFGRKLDRYFFYIMPFFFIVASYAIWRILQFVWEETRMGNNSPIGYGLGLACFAVAVNAFGYPWLANSRHTPQHYVHTDWKTLDQAIVQEVRTGAVMTSRYKSYLFYFNNIPDYVIMIDDDHLRDERHRSPKIDDLEKLKSNFQQETGELYLVLDEWSFKNKAFFDQPMRDFILANCEPVAHGGDPKIMILRKRSEGIHAQAKHHHSDI
jgi:4-amino-4-deoxy-L-arabinose transferase-like glycosyltransferase